MGAGAWVLTNSEDRADESMGKQRHMGRVLLMGGLLWAPATGCRPKLKEVRSKMKFGPSFRHKGSNRTDSVRWAAQQGLEFKWNKGIKTGISYQRRDTDNGNGNNDNTLYFDVSFPIWKAKKKPDKLKKRVKKLEKHVAELEALLRQTGER